MARSTKGYVGFNSPTGKPGHSAGGGRLLYKSTKKMTSTGTGTPGQDAPSMAKMGSKPNNLSNQTRGVQPKSLKDPGP